MPCPPARDLPEPGIKPVSPESSAFLGDSLATDPAGETLYIYTMEYYSAIIRDETGSFVVMWMNLESVIQSEVSQKEKNVIY